MMERSAGKSAIIIVLSVFILIAAIGPARFRDLAAVKDLKSVFIKGTTHQPEKLTELYFSDYGRLAKLIVAGKQYSGNFTIVNHEAATTTYKYQVETIDNNVAENSPIREVTVKNGQTVELPFAYRAQKPGSDLFVAVKLLDQNQEIYMRAQS